VVRRISDGWAVALANRVVVVEMPANRSESGLRWHKIFAWEPVDVSPFRRLRDWLDEPGWRRCL